jgi:hypothetical protein
MTVSDDSARSIAAANVGSERDDRDRLADHAVGDERTGGGDRAAQRPAPHARARIDREDDAEAVGARPGRRRHGDG